MNIKNILRSHYTIEAKKIEILEGYDSTNYKITSSKGVFVLKQNDDTKENLELLKAENRILDRLHLKSYNASKPILSINDEALVCCENQIFRLLSYVEGEFLADVVHTPALLKSFGVFLAKMNKVIHDEHENAIRAKVTQWDLNHFHLSYQYLEYIDNPTKKSLVDYFFLQFEEHILPIQHKLRKGIIHNDANDWNILTTNGEVSGIIDFGDMSHTWIINEIAIAITYVMMAKKEPLEISKYVIKGYHNIFPLEEKELEILYYLVAARLCTSVCNSAYAKTLKPDSAYITISEKPAWDLLHQWIAINPIKAKKSFREAAGLHPTEQKTLPEQLLRRESSFSKALSLSYNKPIQMYRSAFQYMYDLKGNTYLDAYNNIMLAGHCHPKVVRAGQSAMARLNTNTRYLYDELPSYAEKLLAKFPEKLNKVFFVNSGSAASDLAIRMATTHTKRKKIMVLEHGYHGNTRIGIDISHYKYNHQGGPGKQEFIIETPLPQAFRSVYADNGAAGDFFANQTIKQIIANSNQIAAYIAEPIVGCGGQVPLAKGYLKQVYSAIRKQGGVCISDEVQVGFGRLGDYFWGYEKYNVVPDMVVLGKPMGNGHPIAAVICTSEIAESFDNGIEFFSSFGGNPVSCTIGEAVLDVIEEERLQEHAKEVGDYLLTKLKSLQTKYVEIAEVRGDGLFIGIEIFDKNGNENTKLAKQIKNGLRENHILVSTDGPFDSVLKIKPPLSFSLSNSDHLIEHLELQLKHLF